MTNDLEIAIQNFRNTAGRYQRYERCYAGRHDLSFATEKFQSAFGSMFREFAKFRFIETQSIGSMPFQ